ncbi:UNKNOWN [Stylonychia lemnae]|uniref:Transmembrane protein n=1 Tax=Stylonychia lemnae TaxID=5949 RepID=A0A078AIT2_STYLE|nr:UNKNOWN [Stylonychia lemnae]|eukprot:CDW80718.1 UNKNOWN [Stylonychia lemnae]
MRVSCFTNHKVYHYWQISHRILFQKAPRVFISIIVFDYSDWNLTILSIQNYVREEVGMIEKVNGEEVIKRLNLEINFQYVIEIYSDFLSVNQMEKLEEFISVECQVFLGDADTRQFQNYTRKVKWFNHFKRGVYFEPFQEMTISYTFELNDLIGNTKLETDEIQTGCQIKADEDKINNLNLTSKYFPTELWNIKYNEYYFDNQHFLTLPYAKKTKISQGGEQITYVIDHLVVKRTDDIIQIKPDYYQENFPQKISKSYLIQDKSNTGFRATFTGSQNKIELITLTPKSLGSGISQIGGYLSLLMLLVVILRILHKICFNYKLQKELHIELVNSQAFIKNNEDNDVRNFYSYESFLKMKLELEDCKDKLQRVDYEKRQMQIQLGQIQQRLGIPQQPRQQTLKPEIFDRNQSFLLPTIGDQSQVRLIGSNSVLMEHRTLSFKNNYNRDEEFKSNNELN